LNNQTLPSFFLQSKKKLEDQKFALLQMKELFSFKFTLFDQLAFIFYFAFSLFKFFVSEEKRKCVFCFFCVIKNKQKKAEQNTKKKKKQPDLHIERKKRKNSFFLQFTQYLLIKKVAY